MRTQNMTEGRPLPLIMKVALPLMAGSLFQQLYTVVDAAVVGRGIGLSALAALGSADYPTAAMPVTMERIERGIIFFLVFSIWDSPFGSVFRFRETDI